MVSVDNTLYKANRIGICMKRVNTESREDAGYEILTK
jgi:hypothetical protein